MGTTSSRGARSSARLTARGWLWVAIAVLLLAFGYGTGRVGLAQVGYLLLALPAVGWAYVFVVRPRCEVTRRFAPSVVQVGESTRVALRITNTGTHWAPASNAREILPWPAFGDASLPLLTIAPARRAASEQRTGGTVAVSYTIRPPQRGIAVIGPLNVEIRDPFGLVWLRVDARRTDALIVTPAVAPLQPGGIVTSSGAGDRPRASRHAGGREDQHNTREYREGDPLNRVHWRVSARHGQLMVRQDERQAQLEARIIVETRSRAYSDVAGESDSFEWAVHMVASLDAHLADLGYRSRVIETGSPQLHDDASGEELLIGLASIQLTDGAAGRASGDDGGLRGDRTGPILAILSNPDAATVAWLAELVRPGNVCVAFLLPSWGDAERQLTRAGWTCVQVSPATRLDDAWALAGHDAVTV